ncbi:MAG: radical SAM protein [Armatimonadota bacterium]|nr:radical SAM protein [Armatimonadota bacterium]
MPVPETQPGRLQLTSKGEPACGSVAPSVDFRINYQTLRHTWVAKQVRSLLYRWLVGKAGWPLVFKAPTTPHRFPGGVSSHLYVHLPFCSQICPHCPYTKTLYDAPAHGAYGKALRREIEAYLNRPDVPEVRSLYFGGGTPNVTPDLIEDTIALLRPRLAPDAEIGVEVHPADADAGMLQWLHDIGVNRISLGIETFRPDLLKMLARRYTPEEAEEAIRQARALRFECVDVNLLFGIPGQAETETAEDAKRCLALGVDQVSAYQLFTFVHTPIGRRVTHGDFEIYGDRARLRAQHRFSQACLAAGLERSSPWNFTRHGIAPYSTVTQEDYVGFGAGAGSKVGGVFWFNTFSVDAYIQSTTPHPALVLQTDEKFRRAHWLYWRLYRMRVDPADYHTQFGRELEQDWGWALALLRFLRMARPEQGIWQVTEFGSVWMHRIQQLFSITYIDDLWDHCKKEAWPEEVRLA